MKLKIDENLGKSAKDYLTENDFDALNLVCEKTEKIILG